MLRRKRRESTKIEDRRKIAIGSIGMSIMAFGAIIYMLTGGHPIKYARTIQKQEVSLGNDDQNKFISVVLSDTEETWNKFFKRHGLRYKGPHLVLFNRVAQSSCIVTSDSTGIFYCPNSGEIYFDLTFLNQVSNSFGAQSDFATAYVIAHEVGHHVQNLLGVDKIFRQKQRSLNKGERSDFSLLIELQADCLAGVWAKRTKIKGIVKESEIDEALNAASAVGKDRLQHASRGEVVPDTFTHGSFSQRMYAFKTGYLKGAEVCLRNFNQ